MFSHDDAIQYVLNTVTTSHNNFEACYQEYLEALVKHMKTTLLYKTERCDGSLVGMRVLEILYNIDSDEQKLKRVEYIRDIHNNMVKQQEDTFGICVNIIAPHKRFLETSANCCNSKDGCIKCIEKPLYTLLLGDMYIIMYKCNECIIHIRNWNESFINAIEDLVSFDNPKRDSHRSDMFSGMSPPMYWQHTVEKFRETFSKYHIHSTMRAMAELLTQRQEHHGRARELLNEVMRIHTGFKQNLTTFKTIFKQSDLNICKELLGIYEEFGEKSGKFIDSLNLLSKVSLECEYNSMKSMISLIKDNQQYRHNMNDAIKVVYSSATLVRVIKEIHEWLHYLYNGPQDALFCVAGFGNLDKGFNKLYPDYKYDPKRDEDMDKEIKYINETVLAPINSDK